MADAPPVTRAGRSRIFQPANKMIQPFSRVRDLLSTVKICGFLHHPLRECRMRTIMFTLALAAILAFAAPVAAQTQSPQPGQRVMLLLARRQPVEGVRGREVRGTLVAADSTTLSVELSPGATPVRVPRAAVRQTYVSLGVPSRGKSAGLGAVAGMGTGVGTSLMSLRDDHTRSTGEKVMIGVVGGALGGALAGALFPRERWSELPMPSGISIAPTVTSNSRGLIMTIRL